MRQALTAARVTPKCITRKDTRNRLSAAHCSSLIHHSSLPPPSGSPEDFPSRLAAAPLCHAPCLQHNPRNVHAKPPLRGGAGHYFTAYTHPLQAFPQCGWRLVVALTTVNYAPSMPDASRPEPLLPSHCEGQKVILDAPSADSPAPLYWFIPHFSFLIAAAQKLPRQTRQPPSGGTRGLR